MVRMKEEDLSILIENPYERNTGLVRPSLRGEQPYEH